MISKPEPSKPPTAINPQALDPVAVSSKQPPLPTAQDSTQIMAVSMQPNGHRISFASGSSPPAPSPPTSQMVLRTPQHGEPQQPTSEVVVTSMIISRTITSSSILHSVVNGVGQSGLLIRFVVVLRRLVMSMLRITLRLSPICEFSSSVFK